MSEARRKAGDLARESLAHGDATGWFEALYRQADGDPAHVSWADLAPNPNLTAWLDREHVAGGGRRALKIGCGLGDDAEELARRGFVVTAFDVSPTAVAWCRRRFPGSVVRWEVADLLAPPRPWGGAFDFVLESYTLQVLPPAERARAIENVARFVAPHGELLVIARGRDAGDPEGAMPWPLLRRELDAFRAHGLAELAFEDFLDAETPPVRRLRVHYRNVRQARPHQTKRAARAAALSETCGTSARTIETCGTRRGPSERAARPRARCGGHEMTTYEGGCHCGRVRFRVTGTLDEVSDCNCSMCTKKGFLHWIVAPSAFELLAGEGDLTTYRFNTGVARHTFCRHCGIHGFYVPRSDPDKIDVNARCLDGVDPAELRVRKFDGRNWEQAKAERDRR